MIITLSLLQHSPPTQEPIDSDAGIFAFGIRLWSAARRIPEHSARAPRALSRTAERMNERKDKRALHQASRACLTPVIPRRGPTVLLPRRLYSDFDARP